MGFDKGLEIVRNVNKKYEDVREESLSVHSSRQAAFGVVGDVLARAERILAYLSELEKVIEVKDGIGLFCGAWAYIHNEELNVARRVKPVLSVRVDSKQSSVTFRSPDVGITISQAGLTLRFRDYTMDIALTKDEIASRADLLKSLASKLIYFMDSILLRIEACSKYQYNIRL